MNSKFKIVALLLTLMLVMSACGAPAQPQAEPQPEATEATAEEPAAEPTEAPEEEAATDDAADSEEADAAGSMDMTVSEQQYSDTYDLRYCELFFFHDSEGTFDVYNTTDNSSLWRIAATPHSTSCMRVNRCPIL